ncbi:MAG: hypothetical protein AB1689_12450 [Thermodesulfobacteriota bacterium]
MIVELLTRGLVGVRNERENTVQRFEQIESQRAQAREREQVAIRAAIEAEAEAQKRNESALRSLVDTYRLRPPA